MKTCGVLIRWFLGEVYVRSVLVLATLTTYMFKVSIGQKAHAAIPAQLFTRKALQALPKMMPEFQISVLGAIVHFTRARFQWSDLVAQEPLHGRLSARSHESMAAEAERFSIWPIGRNSHMANVPNVLFHNSSVDEPSK